MTTGVKAKDSQLSISLIILGIGLGAVTLWFFWPALQDMYDRWSKDARYSHGYLVPVFSLFLLWYRRSMISGVALKTNIWGLVPILLGAALKLAGGGYGVVWLDGISLLPCLAGVVMLCGGVPALRWSWPAIAFLFFMVPLPYRAEIGVGAPLQWIATRTSTYALQTFGLPALAEGNVIAIGEARINVVEACNGLGMLMMFLAYAAAAALIIDRPPLDRILIVLGAVPIAIFANISRITVTGLLHVTAGGPIADKVYHDLAGWLMMPLALATLWLELQILSLLFVPTEPLLDTIRVNASEFRGAKTSDARFPRPKKG